MLTDGSLPEIATAAGPLPLAVSVDEEGGRVQRLSTLIGSQPSPQGAGADQDAPTQVHADRAAARPGRWQSWASPSTSRRSSTSAPTPTTTVIGDRSFGADPATVTEYAGAYARDCATPGLLPVLKHFPGHGHGSGDSHTGGVVTRRRWPQLQDNDLIPYRTLVDRGAGRRDGRATWRCPA